MANQAIALQARAPQNSILGPSIQRAAQNINMMTQQRAAERQAQQAQQAMDIAAAQEQRAVAMSGPQLEKAKADALAASLDVNSKQAVLVKRDLGVIKSGDINAISNWRERATQLLPEWANILPAAEDIARDRNLQLTIASVIDKIIDKEIASPVATLGFTEPTAEDPVSRPVEVVVGGTRPGITKIGERVQRPTAAAPRATPTTPMGGPVEETAAPMGGGDTRSLSQVISSALETGVMAKTDFDKLLSIAQPESRAKIADWVRSNNIEVMDAPGEMRVSPMSYDGQTPQSEFAVLRGEPMQSRTASLRDAPAMQQTLAQSDEYRPIVLKRPTPPSANVPPPVLGSQKAAETAGSEGVKITTQPKIVAGEERVKRLEKLRGEMPRARSETQTLVTNLTDRINAIDEFLRSPYRNSIIGLVEGRIPRALQTERMSDAQAKYDFIVSNQVLQKLLDDRAQTETGASPQGVVSDRDLAIAATAATKLTQTGSEREQEREMQRLRDVLYRTREQALSRYNDVYREVSQEAPELRINARSVAPRYTKVPPKQSAKTKTKTRLRYNPATGELE